MNVAGGMRYSNMTVMDPVAGHYCAHSKADAFIIVDSALTLRPYLVVVQKARITALLPLSFTRAPIPPNFQVLTYQN